MLLFIAQFNTGFVIAILVALRVGDAWFLKPQDKEPDLIEELRLVSPLQRCT
jgi:hypothetical protein